VKNQIPVNYLRPVAVAGRGLTAPIFTPACHGPLWLVSYKMITHKWYYMAAMVEKRTGRGPGFPPVPLVAVYGCWESEAEAMIELLQTMTAGGVEIAPGSHHITVGVAHERADGALSRTAWLGMAEDPDEVLAEQPGLWD